MTVRLAVQTPKLNPVRRRRRRRLPLLLPLLVQAPPPLAVALVPVQLLPPPLHRLGRHHRHHQVLRRIDRPFCSHATTINGLLQKDILLPRFSSSSQTDQESRWKARYPRICKSTSQGEYPFAVEVIDDPKCSGEDGTSGDGGFFGRRCRTK
jgi:hypothetical protein